jgi:hypothetical protein
VCGESGVIRPSSDAPARCPADLEGLRDLRCTELARGNRFKGDVWTSTRPVSAPTSRRKDWGRRRDTGVAGNHEVAQRNQRAGRNYAKRRLRGCPNRRRSVGFQHPIDGRSAILRAFAPRGNRTKGDRAARQLWPIGRRAMAGPIIRSACPRPSKTSPVNVGPALPSTAPWRNLSWAMFLPLVFAGNVVMATLAWIIVEAVMR